MKLIFCTQCGDVLSLRLEPRKCWCGCSGGYYTDDVNAQVIGAAVPLGLANPSLGPAIERRCKTGEGQAIEAFTIPLDCESVDEQTIYSKKLRGE